MPDCCAGLGASNGFGVGLTLLSTDGVRVVHLSTLTGCSSTEQALASDGLLIGVWGTGVACVCAIPQDTPPSISDVVQLPPTPHPTLDDVIPADDRSVSLSDAFATPAPSYSPTLAGATTSTPAALPAPPTPAPASAPGIVTPTAAAAVVLAAINSFDDEVTLLYDVFAIILAFFFPLATFCGVRFEALLACPGLNVWAVAFAFVVACEVGFEVYPPHARRLCTLFTRASQRCINARRSYDVGSTTS
jgi:hypothetical protein